MKVLLKKIAEKMKKDPSTRVFRDLYHICLEVLKTDIPLSVQYLVELSEELDKAIPSGKFDNDIRQAFSHSLSFLSSFTLPSWTHPPQRFLPVPHFLCR